MELNKMTITRNGETDVTKCFMLCTRSKRRLARMIQTKQANNKKVTLSSVRATVVAVKKQ